MARRLRPYQSEAIDCVLDSFKYERRVAIVIPTGGGKTVIFSHIARDWSEFAASRGWGHERAMVVSHRDELVSQAAKKLYEECGEMPSIEQGSEFSNESEWGRSRFVSASVQSLHPRRLTDTRFNSIGLLIVDECHRCAEQNSSYGNVIKALEEKNPNLRILGVTATPERKDGRKLLFDKFAYTYTLKPAIDDGWLVPIRNKIVVVKDLDFSKIDIVKGDLNQVQLAAALEEEGPLHEIARVTVEEAGDLSTVVFCASVSQAEKTCGIINRLRPGKAAWLCGDQNKFPKAVRREILRQFEAREIQFILNMGVLVEGWDCPHVGMLSIARPTGSTTVYKQAIGRGTRPLDGLVDQPHLKTAEDRRRAIAESAKTHIKILDFVDQSRKHNLVSACDLGILGGSYSEAEIKAAKDAIEELTEQGEDADVEAELEKAQARLKEEELAQAKERLRAEEERRQREADRRKHLVADVDYHLIDVDPFDASEKGTGRAFVAPKGPPPTEKQAAWLEKVGINPASVTKAQANGIIAQIRNGTFKYKPKKVATSPKRAADVDQINSLLFESRYQ